MPQEPTGKKLTAINTKVLEALRFFWRQYFEAPTLRDVTEHCGISSISVVDYSFKKLLRLGYVAKTRSGRYIPIEIKLLIENDVLEKPVFQRRTMRGKNE